MRCVLALVLCGLSAASSYGQITTQHFPTYEEALNHVASGLEFTARADTEKMEVTAADPPAHAETPFDLWTNGVPHAFRVVYNAGSTTGISIDDRFAVISPVNVDPATNGLLLTAFTQMDGRQVRLDNLKLTLPGFQVYDVNDFALAAPPDYLLITTDLPLAGSFILSGQVTFGWPGDLPPPAEQWFEASPVVVPEPSAAALLILGGLATTCGRRSERGPHGDARSSR